jgi:hypothetical protein
MSKTEFSNSLHHPPPCDVSDDVSVPVILGRIFPVSHEAVGGRRYDLDPPGLAGRFVTQGKKLKRKQKQFNF